MRASSLFLALAVAIDAAAASPVLRRAGYALKESTRLPRRWARIGEAPSDAEMVFSLGLQQSRFDELERQLYEGGSFQFLSAVFCYFSPVVASNLLLYHAGNVYSTRSLSWHCKDADL